MIKGSLNPSGDNFQVKTDYDFAELTEFTDSNPGEAARLRNSLAAPILVLVLVMGLTAGWLGGDLKATGPSQTQTTIATLSQAPSASQFVYLDVIPDWGGATYDAFVNPSRANGTVPMPATNSTGPGPMDNNITVSAGVAITFVITNIDTAVLMNFTGPASTDFTVYNDTAAGQVASHYSAGQSIASLPISHTFTITALNLNIPIPPDTVITFTYTFSTPGVYKYVCETPCGPGMGLDGYMSGYLIVS